MDDAALRVDRGNVRLLVRCRETREEAAKRAHTAALHTLEYTKAEEHRAHQILHGHRMAQAAREREVLAEVQGTYVPPVRLQRYRTEVETMAAIGERMLAGVHEAAAMRGQADTAWQAAQAALAMRARDTHKWRGIMDKVVQAQDDAARQAEEGELDDELADRYASRRP